MRSVIAVITIILGLQNAKCQTLAQAAKNAGINFGTMVTKNQFNTAPATYKQTVLNEFNMTFPENELKFNRVEPIQNNFAFNYPDSVVNWAIANGKKTRGHTLVWHSVSQNPKWLTDRVWSFSPNRWTRTQLLGVMKNHIQKVVSHFKGRITEWDIVNEGIFLSDGHPNGLRKSFWLNIIGDDYIDSAFVWAHQADPEAYLYFNEFGAEGNGSWDQAKSDSVYSLAKRLLARKIPIHGIGFQGHFNDYINVASISANIKRIGELGLRVSFTEVDMMNTTSKPFAWKNALSACLENKNCTSFVTWGVDDLHSWMGKDCGCLIWDTLFKPKSAIYSTILSTLNGANTTIAAERKIFTAKPASVPTPVPIVQNKVYCQGDKTNTLTAQGTSLKWYKNINDSIPVVVPVPSSDTAGIQIYYVTQTQNWLESDKIGLKVTINPLPVITHNTRTDTKAWSPGNIFNTCLGENIYTGPFPNVNTGWNWKGPNGFVSTLRNPVIKNISNQNAGIYAATYTDVNSCKSSLSLNILITMPTITITSPSNNAVLTNDIFQINTSVIGTNLSNVSFYNGTSLMGADAVSPYIFTTPNLVNGTYVLSAVAKNTFNCTDTAKVTVKITKVVTDLEAMSDLSTNIHSFPNPFQESMKIMATGNFSYIFYNTSGLEVEKGAGKGSVVVGEFLPEGLYILKIKSDTVEKTLKVNKGR